MIKFICGFLLIVPLFLHSQDACTIHYQGLIRDEHDQKPIPFAKIWIKEINIGATTDTNGYFSITSICPGTYEVICLHHIGCKPLKFTKTFTKNVTDTIYLEYHLQELDEAQVRQFAFKLGSLSEQQLSDLEKDRSLGKTLGEQLKQLPGVESLNTGNSISKPIIHGMHSNRIVLVNNGIRQEGQQWGSEHAPEIDPFLSSELSLVKGANAIRYGSDAIAGVILASTPKLEGITGLQGKLNASASSNGRLGSGSALLQGGISKIKNLSWRVQGTLKSGGTLHSPDYLLKNTAMNERNFSWQVNYFFKKWHSEFFYSQFNTNLGVFSAAHIGNLSDLETAFEAKQPLEIGHFTYQLERPRQHIEHEVFKNKNTFEFNKNADFVLTYGRQYNLRQEFDKHLSSTDLAEGLDPASFQFILTSHQLDAQFHYGKRKDLSGELGISYQKQSNTFRGRYFIPNFEKHSYGLYAIEQYKRKGNVFELGLRADRSDLAVYLNTKETIQRLPHTFQNINASLGYYRLFSHHLLVSAQLSNAWRAPQVNELYSEGLHHGAAAIEIGRRDLQLEKAYNAQVNLTYKSNRFKAQLDLYHSQFIDFIYLRPTLNPQLTIKGAFPVFAYEQIKARFSGFDFLMTYKLGKSWEMSLKGAVVRAFNQEQHTFLVGIPADRIEPALNYEKKLKKGRELNFALHVPLVNKQIRVESNSDYVEPPSAYYLLNFYARYQFTVKKQVLQLSFEVNNLLNHSYRNYLNRFRYYADEMGRNFSLNFTIPFNLKKQKL